MLHVGVNGLRSGDFLWYTSVLYILTIYKELIPEGLLLNVPSFSLELLYEKETDISDYISPDHWTVFKP